MKDAEAAVIKEIERLQREGITENELQKVKNKTESLIAFEDITVMSRAASLAYYELLGNADLINEELSKYNEVTVEQIQQYSKEIFTAENSNVLYYYSNN